MVWNRQRMHRTCTARKIYVNRWKDQLSKQKLLDAARELEYQTNCRRHHLTLSNQLTDEQAHACQDIHESAWGL